MTGGADVAGLALGAFLLAGIGVLIALIARRRHAQI
jgi:hypothetical protein